jgi:membrane protease YdiL (CAAX protease family)
MTIKKFTIEQLERYEKIIKLSLRGIFVFLLFWYSVYFQYIPITIMRLDPNQIDESMQVILSCFSSFVTMFFLFFIYRKDLKKEFQKFQKNIWENVEVGFSCWLVGFFLMMVFNIILNIIFHAGVANNEQAVQGMIKALPFIMLVDAGLLAPFNEEIVFRKTLKDVFGKNKWLFVFLSFLLFGGAHVVVHATTWKDYLFIFPYGSLGAALAYAYYKTDTIYTSMTMHIIHNTIMVLLSIIRL